MHAATAARKPFDPRDVLGCQVWLRSDMGITTVSGAVSNWTNQGTLGSNGDASQTSAGIRPPYSSGGLNGQPKLAFTAHALNWNYAQSGAKTVFVVIKLTAAAGTGYTVYEMFGNSLYGEMIVDLNTYQPVSYVDDWSSVTAMSGHAGALGTTAGHVLMHTYNAGGSGTPGNYTATVEEAQKTIVGSGNYANTDGASHIGSRIPGAFSMSADLYEVIVYSRVLPIPESDQVNFYLKALYAL